MKQKFAQAIYWLGELSDLAPAIPPAFERLERSSTPQARLALAPMWTAP